MKKKEPELAEKRMESTLFSRRENVQKHASYASERIEYEAIKSGDTDKIKALFTRKQDGTPGILSHNELRNSKNMFIASITMFTRAAIEGGVPEESAYAMSDGYIQTVEECLDRKTIENLSRKAAVKFTEEVKKHGRHNYSMMTERAMQYVHLHLHGSITLEETAGAIGFSPCYLSRNFKRETGLSFVDYVQKERIEAACHMLLYSDYTASEISQFLCFSTQSYFIRIFKKYMGVTPAQYRRVRRP